MHERQQLRCSKWQKQLPIPASRPDLCKPPPISGSKLANWLSPQAPSPLMCSPETKKQAAQETPSRTRPPNSALFRTAPVEPVPLRTGPVRRPAPVMVTAWRAGKRDRPGAYSADGKCPQMHFRSAAANRGGQDERYPSGRECHQRTGGCDARAPSKGCVGKRSVGSESSP